MRNINLSSEGQKNSQSLIALLEHRLSSKGKQKVTDTHGNTVYVDTSIYGAEVLESFIHLSISEFNQIPHFTNFTLNDSRFVDCFSEVIVEGAVLHALASKALLERGREFAVTDNGITFEPPSMADMLNTQYSTLLVHHLEKLKIIKNSIAEFGN